jgi:acyl-CoA dehydrogenase
MREGPDPAEFSAYLDGIQRLVAGRLIPAEPRLEGQETLPEDPRGLLRDAGLYSRPEWCSQ